MKQKMSRRILFWIMICPVLSLAEIYHSNDYQIEVNQYSEFQTIELSGEFGFLTSMKPAKQALENLTLGKNTVLIIKNNNGGYLSKFQDFMDQVKSICSASESNSSCKLVTYASGKCNSACIDLFVQGDFRIADDRALFGFHRLWMITPGLSIQSNQQMMDKFVKYGADPDWFKNQTHIFQSKDNNLSILSGYDMVDARMADTMIRSTQWHQTILNFLRSSEN